MPENASAAMLKTLKSFIKTGSQYTTKILVDNTYQISFVQILLRIKLDGCKLDYLYSIDFNVTEC